MPAPAARHLWVLILAGGEGSRIASLTRDASGCAVPKQYSRALGETTLLERARLRAERLVPSARVAVIVDARHRRWWQPLLGNVPVENVIVQPQNRGTAAGLLLSAHWVAARDRAARLLVLPSDHFVRDEEALSESLVDAVDALHGDATRLVLLGMPPRELDPEYGWIVPATRDDELSDVVAFCEKPARAAARRLQTRGALVNTLMFSATADLLLALFERVLPELGRAFAEATGGAVGLSPARLRSLYADLGSRDFSREVLERATDSLRVLRARSCGWTDLGTPERVAVHRRATAARLPDPESSRGRGVPLHH